MGGGRKGGGGVTDRAMLWCQEAVAAMPDVGFDGGYDHIPWRGRVLSCSAPSLIRLRLSR
jgi:hypothetical protein